MNVYSVIVVVPQKPASSIITQASSFSVAIKLAIVYSKPSKGTDKISVHARLLQKNTTLDAYKKDHPRRSYDER